MILSSERGRRRARTAAVAISAALLLTALQVAYDGARRAQPAEALQTALTLRPIATGLVPTIPLSTAATTAPATSAPASSALPSIPLTLGSLPGTLLTSVPVVSITAPAATPSSAPLTMRSVVLPGATLGGATPSSKAVLLDPLPGGLKGAALSDEAKEALAEIVERPADSAATRRTVTAPGAGATPGKARSGSTGSSADAPAAPALRFATETVTVGGKARLVGSGFKAKTTLRLAWAGGKPIGTVTTDKAGAFSLTITLKVTEKVGDRAVVITNVKQYAKVTAAVEVVGRTSR